MNGAVLREGPMYEISLDKLYRLISLNANDFREKKKKKKTREERTLSTVHPGLPETRNRRLIEI